MKAIKAGLLENVVSVYDQTKTTIQGRVSQKVVGGDQVLGPPLNRFVDTFADTVGALTPILSYLSPNGRLFSLANENTGVAFISCHTIDLVTGARTFNGMIRFSMADNAATTHIPRGFKVLDNGTTGWKVFVASTGSTLINGGLYCANNIDLADFLPTGSTLIPFATGSNQKAVYLLQDPAAVGVGQLNIAATGLTLDRLNNRAYVHNGVAATHQFYVYDTAAILNCAQTVGVTIDAATDIFAHNAHGFQNNDPILLSNLSGGAGLLNNGIYFLRNITANTYQVSLTSGGAVVNITTNGTVDVCRAFGTTTSAWVHKTGNLPVLTGTLIASDSEDYAVPAHTANSGQPCVFFCTSSNLYLGRLSELTSGVTTWPSLVTSNILGTINQITAPVLTLATWSNILDRAVYLTNGNLLVMKQVVNNSIDKVFGRSTNTYREGFPANDSQGLGALTITALDIEDGWVTLTGSTVGQRGNILSDLRSDSMFDYSYIVTKVLNTPSSAYKFVSVLQKLEKESGSLAMFYRTSGFGSISGGWISFTFGSDMSVLASGAQVQFKIAFDNLQLGSSVPKQISELFLGLESLFEISDNWEASFDNSDNTSPSRVAFRLKQTYVGAVPQIFFRAYDLSDALLITNNTVANAANFEYSTDNGTSWLPLGTIPNTVGTLIRYTFTSPPGVDIRPSLKES